MAKVWKKLQRSDADYTGNVTGTVDGETAGNIKTKAIAGAASKVVTDAAFTSNVLNVANANDALKNANTTKSDVGLGSVEDKNSTQLKSAMSLNLVENKTQATILGGNLTGTIGGTANATVKSGAIAGAAAKVVTDDAFDASNILKVANANTALKNSSVTMSSAGVLSGAGGGTVSASAIGAVKTDLTNAPNAIKNSQTTATDVGLGSVANASIATIMGNNLTGTIGGTANATIKAGAAAGATSNQDSTSSIRSGTTAANVGLGSVTNESKSTMFASPTFSGTVGGVSATHVGLGSVSNITTTAMREGVTKANVGLSAVDNTSDAGKPVSTAGATAIALKASIASPTFTGTVGGVTSTHVGLGSVSNISTATMRAGVTKANVGLSSVIDQAITVAGDKLKFGGVAQALDADKVGGKTVAQAEASASSTAQTAIIGGAPGALNTLDELAAALGDNANYATTTTNILATKGKAPMILVAEDVDGDSTYTNDPASEVVGQVGVYSGDQYVVVDI
jgi:hypothetical protein